MTKTERKPGRKERSLKTSSSPDVVQPAVVSTPETTDTRITHQGRIDVGKALKLRLQGNTLGEIGKVFGVTDSAVHQALKKFEAFTNQVTEPGQLTAYAEERGNILTAVEGRLIASLMDEGAIEKATLRDRTIAFGTVFDKRRLEQGKSTENVAVLSKIIDAAHDSMRKPQQVVVEPAMSEVAKVSIEDNQEVAAHITHPTKVQDAE